MTPTKTTYAQQAAAAARNGDYDNAAGLYTIAAIMAENDLDNAKSKRHRAKADHFARMAERDCA